MNPDKAPAPIQDTTRNFASSVFPQRGSSRREAITMQMSPEVRARIEDSMKGWKMRSKVVKILFIFEKKAFSILTSTDMRNHISNAL